MSPEFSQELLLRKASIDARAGLLAKQLWETVVQDGELACLPVRPLLDQYESGGKRFRGTAVCLGYELRRGAQEDMILTAAAAIEGLHTYILAFDDMQDDDDIRHGLPTTHKAIEVIAKDQGWERISHDGRGLAYNAALSANHFMSNVLLDLPGVPLARRARALKLINIDLMRTASGQTHDLLLPVIDNVSEEDIERVMYLKTALYTVTMPLQVGLILAGARKAEIKRVEKYGKHVGRAFQLFDDLLPYISTDLGKPNDSDLKEGKITMVILHTLQLASDQDAAFIRSCIGNSQITAVDFNRCKEIMHSCGAIESVRMEANKSYKKSLSALEDAPKEWDPLVVEKLRNFGAWAINRKK